MCWKLQDLALQKKKRGPHQYKKKKLEDLALQKKNEDLTLTKKKIGGPRP
jgi:hypothetical protein